MIKKILTLLLILIQPITITVGALYAVYADDLDNLVPNDNYFKKLLAYKITYLLFVGVCSFIAYILLFKNIFISTLDSQKQILILLIACLLQGSVTVFQGLDLSEMSWNKSKDDRLYGWMTVNCVINAVIGVTCSFYITYLKFIQLQEQQENMLPQKYSEIQRQTYKKPIYVD